MNTPQHISLLLTGFALLMAALTAMTSSPVTPTIKNLTTLVWGTIPSGASMPVPASAIVASGAITPENGGPVGSIENGDGSKVAKIYLDDGFTAEFEIVYDSSLVYPTMGSAVTLTLPTKSGSGHYPSLSSGANVQNYPCTVDSTPVTFTRKKEGMVRIRVSHNPGVEGAPS